MSPQAPPMSAAERLRLRQDLREALKMEGVRPLDMAQPSPQLDRLRRRGLRPKSASTTFTLAEVDGVLLWEEGFGLRRAGLRRGRALRGGVRGEIIERVQADPLPLGNEITKYLTGLDGGWTPKQGLRTWDGQILGDPLPLGKAAAAGGPVLVFVHGTFSNSENLLGEIAIAPNFKAFLKKAKKHYKAIYAFSHPTVSVSPVFNAVEIARHFRGCKDPIDVVAHSRGGLVTRWWLEVMEPSAAGPRRAVLVGCPLDGTSLATPRSLRAALSWLTNVHRALAAATGLATSLIPFLSVVTGLLRVAATATGVLAKAPVLDAGISLVPGLSAMTRVNLELARLNVNLAARPEYFAVASNFAPAPTGPAVWRFITEAKARAADAAADLIFQGENDLVVDRDSMQFLCGMPNASSIEKLLDFGTQDQVHHINYFRQAKTLDFIADSFEL
jgi:pimeloyl-ACP methyl ester carboxylesterase